MTQEISELVKRSYSSNPKYTEIMAGFPEDYAQVKTLRDLFEINYKVVEAKDQIRQNLISKIQKNEVKYPEIIGFEEDVIPALDRAILACHDIMLVGQIGQAKTKIAQTIAKHLLSPMPIIKGSITNDSPMDLPQNEMISLLEDQDDDMTSPKFYIDSTSMDKIRNNKLDTKIEWLEGERRFKYVLATPDISVKDLVGQIDAVKITKKGVEMYQIESYSPGQLMQAKHGLFCIDELPVLDTRKQVALLSVLQEGRFTTGAYPVVFEPKTAFFATANPVDYTHSGKIIEPLYDRLKSHIHTHYPKSVEEEMLIIIQEAKISKSFVPVFILKALARIIQNARASQEINQDKGVSVRMGIHCLELLVSEAERTRALSHKMLAIPRPSDMFCIGQSTKFELAEMDDTITNREKILQEFIVQSVKETSLEYIKEMDEVLLEKIKQEFTGKTFQVSQKIVDKNSMQLSYENQLQSFETLQKIIGPIYDKVSIEQQEFEKKTITHNIKSGFLAISEKAQNELRAAVIEIILEGLCWIEPKILDKKEIGYVAA
ncbi:MAG TPA: AAA domain-containing protein [Nitrosopumilaceae archaeon]|nr:AAA domain-containing protein [Nitrosopumilaceae archaeon]